MKCRVILASTTLPGYKKLYLEFFDPKGLDERKLLRALNFGKPLYIAGGEPKFSLYMGAPKVENEGALGNALRTPNSPPRYGAPSKFISKWWENLRKERPDRYKERCVCGVWFPSEEMKKRHQKRCSVLSIKQDQLRRIKQTRIFRESLREKKKKKVHRKGDNGARRTKSTKKSSKDLQRRAHDTDKKIRSSKIRARKKREK